jgi:uncharacterized protein with HEPN domain
MKRDESVYLRHILDAIIKAEEYLQGLDENNKLAASRCIDLFCEPDIST